MNIDSGKCSRRGFFVAGAAGTALVSLGFHRPAAAAEGEGDETITQIAKFRMNPEHAEEGVAALAAMCQAVEENEPDVLIYICHRSAQKPEEIVFFEKYKNAEALQAHGKTPHLAKIRTLFGKVFLPPLEVTRLDPIGGFARG